MLVFPGVTLRKSLALCALCDLISIPLGAQETPASERAAALYASHCAACHLPDGQGVPGVFPPVKHSDFLQKEREKALAGVLGGLSGPIQVNGVEYHGVMPPALLTDEEAELVLNHILTEKNDLEPVTLDEVRRLRAGTPYPTYEALKAAISASALPQPPAGTELTVLAEPPVHAVRMAWSAATAEVLLLALNGDVSALDPETGLIRPLLRGADYLDPRLGTPNAYGLGFDGENRLYLTQNQRRDDPALPLVMNEVTIFRTEPISPERGEIPKPRPWFRLSYPWGIGPFNHGVSHVAQGPDGFLYVASGARTDGGESGSEPRLGKGGEESVTAAIWRLDPHEEHPTVEIFARGLRNPYGFTWDAAGRFWVTDNGPDKDAPEELNLVRRGGHYGFPHRFGLDDRKWYEHAVHGPDDIEFSPPLRNAGPDAGWGSDGEKVAPDSGIGTFTPHSCPCGIIVADNDFPAPWNEGLLTVRFGNMIQQERETGYDLVHVQPSKELDSAAVSTVLTGLGRPVDLLVWKPGHILIAEYSRGTRMEAGLAMPGRILLWKSHAASEKKTEP